MTFLELCQKLVSECGISGSIASVADQTGEMANVVQWINDAWVDIQRKNTNWDWMRYGFTLPLVAAQRTYETSAAIDDETGDPIDQFSKWHLDTLRVYKTSDGIEKEIELAHMPYSDFKRTYEFGARQSGPPIEFTVRPRGSALMVGPLPDAAYTVYGEYQRRATKMAANADEPDMPSEYHDAIWQRARMKYAARENAAEVYAEASSEFNRLIGELSALQTDDIDLGAPLA